MEPLVYTTKGNLSISTLEYFHAWEDEPGYIKFIQGYKLDGEVVKQEAHVYLKKGIEMEAALEQF